MFPSKGGQVQNTSIRSGKIKTPLGCFYLLFKHRVGAPRTPAVERKRSLRGRSNSGLVNLLCKFSRTSPRCPVKSRVGAPRIELGPYKFLMEISADVSQTSGSILCRGAENRTLASCSQNTHTTSILHPDKTLNPKTYIFIP